MAGGTGEELENWNKKLTHITDYKAFVRKSLQVLFKYLNKHYIKRKGGTKSLHGTENKRLCKIPQVRKGFGD